jgi:hypothetical protein
MARAAGCHEPADRHQETQEEGLKLGKNTGKGYRVGAERDRSQTQTPSGHWVKRDDATGRFMNVKADARPFKGVRREK